MLNDATNLKRIYFVAEYTDLRRGMDGFATIIRFQLDLYDKHTLFLFRGKKTDRIGGIYGKTMRFKEEQLNNFDKSMLI